MKELIEELEGFQTDIKEDLNMSEDLLTTQEIQSRLKDWEHFFRIKEVHSEDGLGANLRSFKESMERVDAGNPENERNIISERLKKIRYQNGMGS